MYSFFKNVLIWNFKRFIYPLPDELLINDSIDNFKNSSYCCNAIYKGLCKYGNKILLGINILLFIIGLCLTIGCDVYEYQHFSFIINLILNITLTFYFIMKFDAWKVLNKINILKLIFIIISFIFFKFLTITFLFLIIFENIVSIYLYKNRRDLNA